MAYPVSSLPVPTTIQKKLATQGISCLTDFIECLPWQDGFYKDAVISSVSRLKLSSQEAAILVSALDDYLVTPKNVTELNRIPPVITYCSQLDQLLSGGVHPGKVLELLGEPGSGCTQLCLQIAVASTIPRAFGGRECQVLYIDCDGGCSPERLSHLAQSTLGHLNKVARSNTQKTALCGLSPEELLGRIHVARCTEYTQLISILHLLR
eukprot:sb/3470296/